MQKLKNKKKIKYQCKQETVFLFKSKYTLKSINYQPQQRVLIKLHYSHSQDSHNMIFNMLKRLDYSVISQT